VLISLPHPANRSSADVDAILAHALFLAWAGAGAVVLSALLGERDRRLRAAATERGRLVAQALAAEERERRRLAELLHDETIQNLLLARQELRDHHRRHDEDSYRRADSALAVTVEQLRGEIFELHPYVLDHAGLKAALTAHAESAARHAGALADVDVADVELTDPQQQLVLSLARELLSNAARHARAHMIRLQLSTDAEQIVLVVADDGAGLGPERRGEALAEGHIGLATSSERAAAAGGSLTVDSAPGSGTTITVRLPRGPA
jgi:two-component system, NarL family, sensor kinase